MKTAVKLISGVRHLVLALSLVVVLGGGLFVAPSNSPRQSGPVIAGQVLTGGHQILLADGQETHGGKHDGGQETHGKTG